MHKVPPKLIEGHNVRNGFAARLDAELLVIVSNTKVLSVNCCDGYSELVWVHLGQLRNVGGVGSSLIQLYFCIHFFYDAN